MKYNKACVSEYRNKVEEEETPSMANSFNRWSSRLIGRVYMLEDLEVFGVHGFVPFVGPYQIIIRRGSKYNRDMHFTFLETLSKVFL